MQRNGQNIYGVIQGNRFPPRLRTGLLGCRLFAFARSPEPLRP
jgi:hypothetical protein